MNNMNTAVYTPKAYIGTYAKYNNGSIDGAWLDLTKYENFDAFLEACAKVHKDEKDPEFMCQDTEYMPDGISFPESFSKKDFEDVITAYKEELQANECSFQIVDYSEKSIVVYGDTKPIKDLLKELGGRFNAHLRNGAGWVFSKKIEDKVRQLLSNRCVSTEISSKNTSKAAQYKAWLAEYCELINDDGYYMKHLEGAVKIEKDGDSFYYLIEKPSIENTFWFHDEGSNYEFYLEVTKNQESKRQYFIDDNLNVFERELSRINSNKIRFNNHRVFYDCFDFEHITEEDLNKLRDAVQYGKERFAKRLNTYLKRWGISKLRFDTYWADR